MSEICVLRSQVNDDGGCWWIQDIAKVFDCLHCCLVAFDGGNEAGVDGGAFRPQHGSALRVHALNGGQTKLLKHRGVHVAQRLQGAEVGDGLRVQRAESGDFELEILALEGHLHHIPDGELESGLIAHVSILLRFVDFAALEKVFVDVARTLFVVPVAEAVRASVDAIDGGERGHVAPMRELDGVGLHAEAVEPVLHGLHEVGEVESTERAGVGSEVSANAAFAEVEKHDALPAILANLRGVDEVGVEEVHEASEQVVAQLRIAEALHSDNAWPGFVTPWRHDFAQVTADLLAFGNNLLDIVAVDCILLVQILRKVKVTLGTRGIVQMRHGEGKLARRVRLHHFEQTIQIALSRKVV